MHSRHHLRGRAAASLAGPDLHGLTPFSAAPFEAAPMMCICAHVRTAQANCNSICPLVLPLSVIDVRAISNQVSKRYKNSYECAHIDCPYLPVDLGFSCFHLIPKRIFLPGFPLATVQQRSTRETKNMEHDENDEQGRSTT